MVPDATSPVGRILDRATEMNIPLNTLFELTYRCNLRCRHCYVDDPGGSELSTSEVKGVLDQLADAGSLFLTLSGGEVLLREDWFEICQYARQKNFALRLFTNGTLIDRETAKKLADLGLVDIGLSLYGATASTHEQVTTVPGSFARAVSALKLLREAGVKTVVKFLLMKHNVEEYNDVRMLSERLGATFSFSFYIGPKVDGSPEPCRFRVADSDLLRILQGGFLYPDRVRISESERVDLRGSALDKVPMCGAGRDTCAISPYGDVYPCAILPIKAGNLREDSFSDLWFGSSRLEELRRVHMSDLKGCKDCRSLGYCGRCPAFAMLEDGDLLGPSTFACKIEKIGQMSP